MNNGYDKIIKYAKKIAVYQKTRNLVNGLQNAETLSHKYNQEWAELEEAIKHKTFLHCLHEVADVYYYACQLQYQTGDDYTNMCLSDLTDLDFKIREIVNSCLAKYKYRSGGPNRKNEQEELALIAKSVTKGWFW